MLTAGLLLFGWWVGRTHIWMDSKSIWTILKVVFMLKSWRQKPRRLMWAEAGGYELEGSP